ncbi:hypothetical protein G3V96_26440 [Escherichia coli]|nr:hypothetical protein [Escherichia coli]
MKYELTRDCFNDRQSKKGVIVYQARVSDYGMASEDSDIMGCTWISVTYDPAGGYPLFTVPKSALKELPQ